MTICAKPVSGYADKSYFGLSASWHVKFLDRLTGVQSFVIGLLAYRRLEFVCVLSVFIGLSACRFVVVVRGFSAHRRVELV